MSSFGKLKIGKIKKYHVMDFFDKLKQPDCEFLGIKYNLSPATIKNHLTCLNSIFTFAVDREYIKESPVKGVKTPSVPKNKPTIYDKKDLAALFAALEDEPLMWKTIVWFAVATGAREGEIAGLERKHLSLKDRTVEIEQAAICVKGEGVKIKSTKTGNYRPNKLPESLISILSSYLRQHDKDRLLSGDTWVTEWNGQTCNFVFTATGSFGKPLRPDSISQWWSRFLKKRELKHIKFHALRHTSVALSIDEGDNMKAISERVGHSKIGTTMDIYGQLLEDGNERSAKLIDHALKNIIQLKA